MPFDAAICNLREITLQMGGSKTPWEIKRGQEYLPHRGGLSEWINVEAERGNMR